MEAVKRRERLSKKISNALDGEMMEDILPVLEVVVAFAVCVSYEDKERMEAFQKFTSRTLKEIAEMSLKMEADEANGRDKVH